MSIAAPPRNHVLEQPVMEAPPTAVRRGRGWPQPKPNPNAIPAAEAAGRTGSVIALHLHTAHRMPLVPVREVTGRRNGGLVGDSHELRRNRAVTVVDRSTLDALDLKPADLREQITIEGLPEITNLARGTRVRVGGLTLRINGVCAPCTHIGTMLGRHDVEAFRQTLEGRRGSCATVVSAEGPARLGDMVVVLAPRQPTRRRTPAARSESVPRNSTRAP